MPFLLSIVSSSLILSFSPYVSRTYGRISLCLSTFYLLIILTVSKNSQCSKNPCVSSLNQYRCKFSVVAIIMSKSCKFRQQNLLLLKGRNIAE